MQPRRTLGGSPTLEREELDLMADPIVTARRTRVIRRLLDRGLTPRTLSALLPEWEALIHRVATRAPLG